MFTEFHEHVEAALLSGNEQVVRFCLYENAIELDLNTILIEAVVRNQLETVTILLKDSHVEPSENCMYLATIKGYDDIVCVLLQDSRIDPTFHDSICFYLACYKGYTTMVDHFMEDGRIDPSCNNNTCLYWAAQKGFTPIVKRLLQDPRVTIPFRSLTQAIQNNCYEIVALFLEHEDFILLVQPYILKLVLRNREISMIRVFLKYDLFFFWACERYITDIVRSNQMDIVRLITLDRRADENTLLNCMKLAIAFDFDNINIELLNRLETLGRLDMITMPMVEKSNGSFLMLLIRKRYFRTKQFYRSLRLRTHRERCRNYARDMVLVRLYLLRLFPDDIVDSVVDFL